MATEKHLPGTLVEEDEDPISRRFNEQGRNIRAIDNYLGEGRKSSSVAILPRYYGELLTWALQRHIIRDNWKVLETLGCCYPEPTYIDVNADCNKRENLLVDGQLLIQKNGFRLVVTVDIYVGWRNAVKVEGLANSDGEITGFIDGIQAIATNENFYRGKKIKFGARLRFLDIHPRSWDSIVLDTPTKAEIKANTTGFLNNSELWTRFGIPLKRGVLIVGEPGTGKTAISKAIMTDADGITCIVTNAYELGADEYITGLYACAQDLSPCIVFIEDIDLIAQDRATYGYHKGPALLSLLAELDGVEEHERVVTVATTNYLEKLDRAIRARPSRFDRIIKLSYPTLSQRRDLIGQFCEKIPLDDSTREYIARKAENFTPAQLKELVHSLIIEYADIKSVNLPQCLDFSKDYIDNVISKITTGNGRQIGFSLQPDRDEERFFRGINTQEETDTKLKNP